MIIVIDTDQKSKTEANSKLNCKFKSSNNERTVFLLIKELNNIMRSIEMKLNIKKTFFLISVVVSSTSLLAINITLNYAFIELKV